MDFNLDEQQQAIADLATRILTDRVTHERLKEIEASLPNGEWFDRDSWGELAKAGLIGIAVRDDVGGGGLGLVELGQVHEAQGRTVAPIPLLPTTAAALAIDAFGSDEQRRAWLPGVCDGSVVLSVALQEPLDERIATPGAVASASGNGWTLTGTKAAVEFVAHAARVVVSATAPDGPALFLVDPKGVGISVERQLTTRREPVWDLALTNAPAERLDGGSAVANPVEWLEEHMLALLCSTQVGVTDHQLKTTAAYASTRQQFGRPIATFQAVTQRLADQYINREAIKLCTYSAVWRLANGFDAGDDLRVAKWYSSDAAHEVAHATQHIHGGAGVDIENPVHRYTLWNKHLEVALGAGTTQLRALGAQLAAG